MAHSVFEAAGAAGGAVEPAPTGTGGTGSGGGWRSIPAVWTGVLLALGVVAVQALLVPLFAWPAAETRPRHLPVLVAGPAPAAEQFTARLAGAEPGAFDITRVDDAAAADERLRDRRAYAAFILGSDGVALHTASAAGPIVATLLTQAAGQLGDGGRIEVTDVVPTDPDDPRGSGFGAGFLPLAMTSVLVGALLVLVGRGRWGRLAGIGAFAALAAGLATVVLQYWLGILPAHFAANAAAIGLFTLAAAAMVTGLGTALGRVGIGLGALLVFLVGNPISGVTSAPELLPRPWGEVGQWLPAGAGGTALRGAAYFDWAGTGRAVWVLAGWSALGLALVLLGGRAERRAPEPAA